MDSNIVLYNTKGDFQINEPLEINGISVGRNVGVSTDFEFSDVKSVSSAVGGGELFLANTELSGEVRPFNLGDEFQIASVSGSGLNQTGTMTCAGVADFRTLVKVGDIVSYALFLVKLYHSLIEFLQLQKIVLLYLQQLQLLEFLKVLLLQVLQMVVLKF